MKTWLEVRETLEQLYFQIIPMFAVEKLEGSGLIQDVGALMVEQEAKVSTGLFDPIKTQAMVTKEVLVGFSGGKDSIVTIDLCMRYFDRVQPFFMYLVPDISFQNEMLDWYEKKYGLEIIRIPHFEVSSFLKYGSFRDPDMDMHIVKTNDTYAYLRQETGIEWIAAGERIKDSIVRRGMIKGTGSIDYKRKRFFPVAYWSKKEILGYIKAKKLKLPRDSKVLGFSWHSLEGRELAPLRRHFPEDFKKIEAFYPFAGAAAERFERYGK